MVGASVALFAGLGVDTGTGLLIVALALSGVGQAFVFNVSNVIAMSVADATEGGLASGVINEVRQLGALIGLAAVGAALRRSPTTCRGITERRVRRGTARPEPRRWRRCVLETAVIVARSDAT